MAKQIFYHCKRTDANVLKDTVVRKLPISSSDAILIVNYFQINGIRYVSASESG
jgi:hypothetical protein